MKDLAEALRSLVARVGEFFDIFDLSFIVSGAATLSAFAAWWKLSGRPNPIPVSGWLRVFSVILGCYVAGLFCFALGRWIRLGHHKDKKNQEFMKRVRDLARAHGLDQVPEVDRYLKLDNEKYRDFRLYIRLWAELRENVQSSPSLYHLNRAWVLAATYDGVSISALIWLLVIIAWMCGVGLNFRFPVEAGVPISVILLAGVFSLQREAWRSQTNQADELFATVAAVRGKLLKPAHNPGPQADSGAAA